MVSKAPKVVLCLWSLFVFDLAHSGELDSANVMADSVHSNGKTALMLAAREGDLERVQHLLALGAEVNRSNNNGGTPIMYAALGGNIEIVRLLIQRDASLNASAKNGWSALMIAAAKGHSDIVRELLNNDADPNIIDVYQWSPLMRAVSEDREPIVKLLVVEDATNLDHTGENGITALHIATVQGYPHLVEILLRNGADATIRDHSGRTPYQIAKEGKKSRLVYLLEQN